MDLAELAAQLNAGTIYLLTGYTKRDPRSNKAALKYLLIGASSTAVFLYGVSLLYGLSGGQTELSAIAQPDFSGFFIETSILTINY
jgi:NADH:ubiquinone oxidoreductase subunit 2 (subunit N)